jgi:hypothetical protein
VDTAGLRSGQGYSRYCRPSRGERGSRVTSAGRAASGEVAADAVWQPSAVRRAAACGRAVVEFAAYARLRRKHATPRVPGLSPDGDLGGIGDRATHWRVGVGVGSDGRQPGRVGSGRVTSHSLPGYRAR